MKLHHILSLTVGIIVALTIGGCGNRVDDGMASLVAELDEAIAKRPGYIAERVHRIDSLRECYRSSQEPAEKFEVLGALFDEYRSYNSDSTLIVCRLRQQIAPYTGNPYDVVNADLNLAEQLGATGNYLEALQIVEPLNSSNLPEYLHAYLYHIKRTIYGLLADNALRDEDRHNYEALTDCYRDSILSVNSEGSLPYNVVLCDKLNSDGRPAEGAELLTSYRDQNEIDAHGNAIIAITLADSYRRLGDHAKEKEQLLVSSIHDMRSAVKEYISLRSLALLLYQEGDVQHAYEYLRTCMQDAQDSNARQRMVELNGIFPVVNEVYLDTINSQQRRLKIIISIVCLLVIVLIVAILFILKQKAKVTEARRNEAELNRQLKGLNDELRDYNERLLKANQSIAENSSLKEEYIARYMDQCLAYIDKIDAYRKSLNKLALAERIDEIKKQTKSVAYIDGELKSFYDNFDETFLRLFPTFIEDFNSLLKPDEQIVPKNTGCLNTELRIFALIRLGINDSVKIAKFLRYSVTTIYNYRTRIRNRAAGDRDRLEVELMQIGRNQTPGKTSL